MVMFGSRHSTLRKMASTGLGKCRFSFTLTVLMALSTALSVAEQDSLVLIPGDVMIAAMFGINDAFEGECGDYDVSSLQEMMAVTWFVDSLNQMNYINNVTVGLEVYRTCKTSTLASKGVVSLLNKYRVDSETPAHPDQTVLFGVIGPDRSAEAAAVSRLIGSLPTNQRLLQISGSATAKDLSDKELYGNFFRVIPSDETQIQVILSLVLQLDWNYVAIVFEDDDYGRSMATDLRKMAEAKEVCVPVFASLRRTEDFDSITRKLSTDQIRGLIFLGGQLTFQQFLPILTNSRWSRSVQLILSEAVGIRTRVLWGRPADRLVTAGSLLTAPPLLPVPEFSLFWNKLWTNRTFFQLQTNAWIQRYLQKTITECSLSDEDCWAKESSFRSEQIVSAGSGSRQNAFSLYLGYQVKAAAVMMSLLKRVLEHSCGPNFQGLCPESKDFIADREQVQGLVRGGVFHLREFASVSASLADLSLCFDARGGVKNLHGEDGDVTCDVTNQTSHEDYDVYNLKKTDDGDQGEFRKVGTYTSGRLSLTTSRAEFYDQNGEPLTWGQLPHAQCPANRDCLTCERDVSGDIIFLEGDFYVVAVLPVHNKIEGNLLRCGAPKGMVGADIIQAVIFALEQVNDPDSRAFKDLLPGRRVGLVGISSCGSSLIVRQRLMDFFSGRLQLPGGRGNSSTLLPHLMGIIGAYYSANSIAVSDTLTTLNTTTFVQVSAASTSTVLKDRGRHPYFMRLVPADDKQAQVMLDIVKTMNANYIQVIYDSSTAYATGLFEKLQEETSSGRYNICIAQSIPTTLHEQTSQYKYIVDVLREESAAKIVIVILHATVTNKTMTAILPLLTSEDNFLFLGSESWGRRHELIKGRTRLDGSLVLSQEIAADKQFEQHLDTLPAVSAVNPWLKDFWEARLNCYLDKSFRREGRKGPCIGHVAQDYVQDSRIPFHIQAVYALVKGFHTALTLHCGDVAKRTCKSLTSSQLVRAMHDVQLDLYSRGPTSPVFDSNGDGLVGYNVLRVARDRQSAHGDVVFLDSSGKPRAAAAATADRRRPGQRRSRTGRRFGGHHHHPRHPPRLCSQTTALRV
ncbi:uncharacterized protein LOC143298804 isoform X2 [Babylonia areolata]|uniref:uncharacterized protein LOC143298804 isoform X2 n=1 Tax=Babylonia areolata TaxID=304850 RepID=UPI003FD196FB